MSLSWSAKFLCHELQYFFVIVTRNAIFLYHGVQSFFVMRCKISLSPNAIFLCHGMQYFFVMNCKTSLLLSIKYFAGKCKISLSLTITFIVSKCKNSLEMSTKCICWGHQPAMSNLLILSTKCVCFCWQTQQKWWNVKWIFVKKLVLKGFSQEKTTKICWFVDCLNKCFCDKMNTIVRRWNWTDINSQIFILEII